MTWLYLYLHQTILRAQPKMYTNFTIACVIIFFFCRIELANAQMYGMLLGNPINPFLSSFGTNKNAHMLSHEAYEMSNQEPASKIRCKQDSDCIDDNSADSENLMYCDRHYGYCDSFRKVGDLCRHDSQCDSGLICMFGKCAQPFAQGNNGARCSEASDCNAGLCCARQHGERICKPKLKLGHQCFVPEGGLDYSLNELCPCDEGFECKRMKAKSKRLVHCQRLTHIPCANSLLCLQKATL